MVPALAHKGVYRWRCSVKGHAAHSSLTPQAVNAIEVGARVTRLADMSDRLRASEPRFEGFDVPYSTGSVGVIEGGIADNVVPEDCRFHYEFRNLPGSDVGVLQTEIEAYAKSLEPAMRAIDAASGIRFEELCAMPAFLRRGRRSGGAPRAPARGDRCDDARRVRHRGGAFPARRHSDGRVRPGTHRAGAPGRRIRVARAARCLRALPARAVRTLCRHRLTRSSARRACVSVGAARVCIGRRSARASVGAWAGGRGYTFSGPWSRATTARRRQHSSTPSKPCSRPGDRESGPAPAHPQPPAPGDEASGARAAHIRTRAPNERGLQGGGGACGRRLDSRSPGWWQGTAVLMRRRCARAVAAREWGRRTQVPPAPCRHGRGTRME